jgi:hypothetical protein
MDSGFRRNDAGGIGAFCAKPIQWDKRNPCLMTLDASLRWHDVYILEVLSFHNNVSTSPATSISAGKSG